MADSTLRRPNAAFVFEVSDLEQGLDIDHQYDRSVGVPRPDRPILLRVDAADRFDGVIVIGMPSRDAVAPGHIVSNGVHYPGRRVGGHWEVVLPGMDDGTIFHYIVAARDRAGSRRFADGDLDLEDATVFTHRVTTRRPPDWTRGTVVYQVFIDRFANSHGPVPVPANPNGWAGGDLNGVAAALPYLSDLGVNALWLTPVFACHSYHGYDTTDFGRVDDRFGGNAAFAALVEAADRLGIRVILDFVPNHVSDRHRWFQTAVAGGETRDWFSFADDGSYATFFGARGMPKVNLTNPDAAGAMVDAAMYWLDEFGVAGYRIDHVLGPEESFFAGLAAALNARHPEAWLFGEATASAAYCRRYGGLLDGATDFMLAYAFRDLMVGALMVDGFIEIEQEAAAVLPHEDFSWVRFFDNHDMSRARHLWDGNAEDVARAAAMLFRLPGVPSLFYGTEQGLTHAASQEFGGLAVGRIPMRFDDPVGLVTPIRDLIRARAAATISDPPAPVHWLRDGTSATWTWNGFSGSVSAPG